MKNKVKFFLVLLVTSALFSKAQNGVVMVPVPAGQRCYSADSYNKVNEQQMTPVTGSAAICFTDDICAFYTPETGSVSFHILPGSKYTTKEDRGITTYFDNDESPTLNPRTYFVQVTITTDKTVVVINVAHGDAIEFEDVNALTTANPTVVKVQTLTDEEQQKLERKKNNIDSIRAAGDTGVALTTDFGNDKHPIQTFPYFRHPAVGPCTIVIKVDVNEMTNNTDKAIIVSDDSNDPELAKKMLYITENIIFNHSASGGTITYKFGLKKDAIPGYNPKYFCYKRMDR